MNQVAPTLWAFGLRVGTAYLVVMALLRGAEQLTTWGGFPSGTGAMVAAGGVMIWNARLARAPITAWTPWQWSFFFSGGTVLMSRPWASVFDLWLGPVWSEYAAAIVAALIMAVGVKIGLRRQRSREQDADEDAQR